jgi:adenosylcobinamide-phosphate synthase
VLQRWESAGGGHRTDIGGTAGAGAHATRSAPEVGSGSGTLRLARPAAAQAVLAAYREVFAPLFWYALLPGAIGPVLYLFARFAACHSYPFALTAYHWMDWIPLRLASSGLALAGRFEDAMFCLRAVSGVRAAHEAAPDPFLHQRVLLLPVAGGALGLRLTDAAVDSVLRAHAPDLDLPEADSQPLSLQPVVGLLMRSSVLWVGLYLLVKVLD